MKFLGAPTLWRTFFHLNPHDTAHCRPRIRPTAFQKFRRTACAVRRLQEAMRRRRLTQSRRLSCPLISMHNRNRKRAAGCPVASQLRSPTTETGAGAPPSIVRAFRLRRDGRQLAMCAVRMIHRFVNFSQFRHSESGVRA
jgi:hypothetical protein